MLPEIFRDKSIGVLLVGFSPAILSLLSDVLGELGYSGISDAPDIDGAITVMKNDGERPNWILVPLTDKNGISILSLLETTSTRENTLVSIFREKGDSAQLEKAFARGVLSWHPVDGSREDFLYELGQVTAMFAMPGVDDTLIAARYLMVELMTGKRYARAQELYNTVSRHYPHNHSLTLLYAEALHESGQQKKALATIFYLRAVSPELKNQADALLLKLGREAQLETAERCLGDYYDLKLCLVVDPNEQDGQVLASCAKKIGFQRVITFRDPVAATQWLNQNSPPDLIICEWTLPKIPGPIFLYRLRNKHDLQLPLIICNEKISERDAIMFNELGASVVLGKPLDQNLLPDQILWTVMQHRNPTDYKIIRRQLTTASQSGEIGKVQFFKDLLTNHPDTNRGDLSLIEAILAYNDKNYEDANEYATMALNQGGDIRESMEVLGKALMKLRRFELATRCLEDVRYLSPTNVTHLCDLAECYLEQNDDKNYDEMLHAAKKVDEEDPKVIETEVKGELKRKNVVRARYLMQKLKSYEDILAFMNNRAVSLIHTGHPEDGFDLYRQTIAALPQHRQDLSAVVHYNLGLGYAKSNRLADAKDVLVYAQNGKNPDISIKAARLVRGIEKALAGGKQLVFAAKQKAESVVSDKEEMIAKMCKGDSRGQKSAESHRPGLMKIYQINDEPSQTSQLENLPQPKEDSIFASDDENIVID